MSTLSISKKEMELIIERAVRESVKEVLSLEIRKSRSFLIPYVSDEEQREIEKKYKKPSKRFKKLAEIEL